MNNIVDQAREAVLGNGEMDIREEPLAPIEAPTTIRKGSLAREKIDDDSVMGRNDQGFKVSLTNLLMDGNKKVLYRVLDSFDNVEDIPHNFNYALEHPSNSWKHLISGNHYIGDIRAHDLYRVVNTTGFVNRGRLFAIALLPGNYIDSNSENDELKTKYGVFNNKKKLFVFINLSIFYNIIPLHNTPFGQLTFNLNSARHNFILDSIRAVFWIARNILLTGGLGGMDGDQIPETFHTYSVEFLSSAGNIGVERKQIRYYRWTVRDFPTEPLLAEFDSDKEIFNKGVLAAIDKVEEALRKRLAEIDQEYLDNDDLDADLQEAIAKEDKMNPRVQFKMALLRINEVSFKFMPGVVNTPVANHYLRASSYDVNIINPKKKPPSINPEGDHKTKKVSDDRSKPLLTPKETMERERKKIEKFLDLPKPISTSLAKKKTVVVGSASQLVRQRSESTRGRGGGGTRGRGRGKTAVERKQKSPPLEKATGRGRGRPRKDYPPLEMPSYSVRPISGGTTIKPMGFNMLQEDDPFAGIREQINQQHSDYTSKASKIQKRGATREEQAELNYARVLWEKKLYAKLGLNPKDPRSEDIYKEWLIKHGMPTEDRNKIVAYEKRVQQKIDASIEKDYQQALDRSNAKKARKVTLKESSTNLSSELARIMTPGGESDTLIKAMGLGKYKKSSGAGCIIDRKLEASLSRMPQIYTPSHIDGDTHCVFRCLIKYLNTCNEKEKNLMAPSIHSTKLEDIEWVREHELILPPKGDILLENLNVLAAYYNANIYIWEILPVSYESVIDSSALIDKSKPIISHVFNNTSTYPAPKYDEEKGNDPQTGVYPVEEVARDVHLLWYQNHSYLILDKPLVVTKVKCSLCHQWISGDNFFTKHAIKCRYCSTCKQHYSISRNNPTHECLGARVIRPLLRKQSQEIRKNLSDSGKDVVCVAWNPLCGLKPAKKLKSLKSIWVADIETFPNAERNQEYIPYYCGVMNLANKEREPNLYFGKNCMIEMLKFLSDKKGILYFYNGSRFDNFFVIQTMLAEGYYISPESFIKHGSGIIGFDFNHLKVRDLCLFLRARLVDACKAWGVPADLSKKEFDHSKVFDWLSANEHREEVAEYLKYDIISLGVLYQNYSATMMDCFARDINKAITPSHYAMQVWRSMIGDVADQIYTPHKGKEENDDRAAYYGGRVMCQRKEYISSQVDEEDYDFIHDCLILSDVNSLYPTAMKNYNFAVGKWKYTTFGDNDEEKEIEMLRFIHNTQGEEIAQHMFKVDYICPKDLITAFLIARDEKTGKLSHDLTDKVNQWLWGCEIEEAVLLGYKFIRVYEVKTFEKMLPIFKSFVDLCWDGRKKNPKPSLKNEGYKTMMNSLSGKMAQLAHASSSLIYGVNYTPTEKQNEEFQKMASRVQDFEIVFSDVGNILALILDVKNENADPRYPVYLSAQILAHSRCIMSRYMRICDSYRNSARAIYYTDTDSLVIPFICLPALREQNCIGKEIGQLSCDIMEPFTGKFAKIVKAVWGATKGPYALVYRTPAITRETPNPLKVKIRIKGRLIF